MTSKHTPGQWVIANSDAYNTVVIAQGAEICTVIEHQGGDRKANARLIAAAPELLAALRGAMERWGDVIGSQDHDFEDAAVLSRARAAIARAEGRS